jgi:hypothetical protein
MIYCPNCDATMGEGEPCPECDHYDDDYHCQCLYCQSCASDCDDSGPTPNCRPDVTAGGEEA